MQSWKQIWANRPLAISSGDPLEQLIRADGFDSGPGAYSVGEWRNMVSDVLRRCDVPSGSTVLELGCGAGAFLLEIGNQLDCKAYGIDYSSSLIEVARKFIPDVAFEVAEATHIPFAGVVFDTIFSHSVFQYFPDTAYAERVISACARRIRPGGTLCILDVNDKAHEQHYHQERRSKSADPEEYDRMYKDMPHMFYDRDAFAAVLQGGGFANVVIFEHASKEYQNAKFRFNVKATMGPEIESS